ncbi:hypothetical protein J4558_08040 [Leptolyngbya sp. 15MV]|nr:hypothetical protein J4558_08040 [Leptolyngbya sp. 15MV]
MSDAIQVLGLLMVAATAGLSLAHALEFPGKLRLNEDQYRTVQTIYYPGFTIGGLIAEAGSLLVVPVLLVLTPPSSEGFRWVGLGALLLAIGHAIYWAVTHPVNAVWLKGSDLTGMSARFFAARAGQEQDWRLLRNVWEWSHVARTVVFALALLCLALASQC